MEVGGRGREVEDQGTHEPLWPGAVGRPRDYETSSASTATNILDGTMRALLTSDAITHDAAGLGRIHVAERWHPRAASGPIAPPEAKRGA